MFPKAEFDKKQYEPDVFANSFPALKLEDLQPKQDIPIKMSFMMSFTENRKTQLAISLECLARQTFKEFEVLICDDGSRPQGMEEVYDKFRPYLHLKTIRIERQGFSACPSRGLKTLIPLAQGEIFVAMQPEMMLTHDCAKWLYYGHSSSGFVPDGIPIDVLTWYVNMDRRPEVVDLEKPIDKNAPRFICVKNGFLNFDNQVNILHGGVDWHSDTRNVEKLPQFWMHREGISAENNEIVLNRKVWPWWFVCSMKATDSIWKDMPYTIGHASIDFYFLNYRAIKGYIDICPKSLMAYHQYHSHQVTSISPIGEQEMVANADNLKKLVGI
jgi:glycosyltransferase involved in cell wall biosynthesis